MIIRALALALATVLGVGETHAQTIVARSGEHGDFTRLVMRIPDGVDWSVTQSEQIATLNVGAPTVQFNTQSVFDLIPRSRIADIRQDGPGQPLRIDLACECVVDYYQQSDGYLVLDVRSGELATAEENNTSDSDPRLPLALPMVQGSGQFNLGRQNLANARVALDLAGAVRSSQGSSTSVELSGAIELPLVSDVPSATKQSNDASKMPQDVAEAKDEDGKSEPEELTADSSLLMDFDENRRAAMVNDTEQRLLQQIGRATQQGLLEQPEGEASAALLDPLGNDSRPLNPLENMSVTSAIDRETGLWARGEGVGDDQLHCLNDYQLAIHSWGGDGDFTSQLGALRNSILGEFDQLNAGKAIELARLYLHYGFGAEARATLSMLSEEMLNATTRDVMNTMADILDSRELPVNTVFSGQQTCKGDAAFWAAMSDQAVKKTANTDAIQQFYARLPPHLRVLLGPRLTTFFAEAGDHHVAKASMRALERSGIEEIPERNLAEAAIAELEGDHDAVAKNLTEEVAAQSLNAPEALIELIDLSFQERKAVSPDVPELTASYELQNRKDELGIELRRAQVVALALSDRFDEAFQIFEKVEGIDGTKAATEAIVPFYTLLTENASNVKFLKYALDFAERTGATRASLVGEIVAQRLLELGFPEQADALLKKINLDHSGDTIKLMRAEALLAMQLAPEALGQLEGLSGQRADALKAKALWLINNHEEAAGYLISSGDLSNAARGYWHAENLEGAEELGDEAVAFGAVAAVTDDVLTASEAPSDLPPLAEARALVESSIGARSSIEELLNSVKTSAASE